MIRLIVLRHAKSAWNTDAPDDHARPLNKRGRRAAIAVASELLRCDWVPDRVLSSDATRCRETWQRMATQLSDIPAVFLSELYHAGLEEVTALLGDPKRTDTAQTIMVIGHNPGWDEVVEGLTDEQVTMTTANAALLECDAPTWGEAVDTKSKTPAFRLTRIVRPRELPKSGACEFH